MDKKEIVRLLDQHATILELLGESGFRVRAYQNGARALDDWEGDLAALVAEDQVASIRGIGKSLAAVISDLVRDGRSAELDDKRAEVPGSLLDLLAIYGLGAKKVRALHDHLGISSLDELEEACRSGAVQSVPGFGKKSEADILRRIAQARATGGEVRHPVDVAERLADEFLEALRSAPGTVRVAVAGSLRRRLETIGDIDLLVSTTDAAAAREAFFAVPQVEQRIAEGETKCRVQAVGGMGVDLRVVEDASFAAALHYFTGSKAHNTHLRAMVRERGWKLNEYGLWDERGEVIPTAEERDIFAALGLADIPAELREDDGEIEAAQGSNALAPLVTLDDIRGVLHVHTTESDGRNTLEEMVAGARQRGWSYLGTADHSRALGHAGGLSEARLRRQGEEIRALAPRLEDDGFSLFHGAEVEIHADGSLDYADDVLAELDYVIVAVHSAFELPRDQQTARLERALRHPATTVWAHPMARIIGRREAISCDLDHLLTVAAEQRVIVELNAIPHRLDLDWRWGRRLRELELDTGVFPDAHSVDGLDVMRHGIGLARKAGLGPERVVNTLSREAIGARLGCR